MISTTIRSNERAGKKEWIALVSLALPTLLISIDTSVLYLALPHLSAALKASSRHQLWIMDIYGFMIAGFLITMGNLGDRLGYRRLLMTGSAIFGLASFMAAFSTTAMMLIAARAVMGIAGATLMPSALAIIRNMFGDARQRGTAISIWMSCFMLGMIAGPLVGGIVLEYFWWGCVFLVGVPIMMIVVFAGKILLPEYRNPLSKPLDGISVTLSLGAVLPFIYGVTELSRVPLQYSAIAYIISGVVVGCLFVFRERVSTNALVDLTLFNHSVFSVTTLAMLLTALIMGGISLFMAQYLQLVMELSPFYAGVWMIPQAIAMILGSLMVPYLTRTIPPHIVIATGFVLSCMGMLLLTAVPVANGLLVVQAGFVTAIIGVSPILILGTGIIIGAVPQEKAGAAASIAETSNQLGIALGVALLGSIGNYMYHQLFLLQMPAGLSTPLWKAAGESLSGATQTATGIGNPLSRIVLLTAKAAFVKGFQGVALISALLFAGLAVITQVKLSKVLTV